MNADAVALVARARGLRRHVAAPVELAALARLDRLGALGDALARLGLARLGAPVAGVASAAELAHREHASELLGVLGRWRGRGRDVVAIELATEERRALRALARGAAQGVPAELRLAGQLPTPDLSPRRLARLAGAADPLEFGKRLIALDWPDAPAIARATAATRPDLGAVERLLRARWHLRLGELARVADTELRREIEAAIDLENGCAAAALAGSAPAARGEGFLAGGRELDRRRFGRAVATADPGAALALVAGAFLRPPIRDALREAATMPSRTEELVTAARHALALREARVHPLGGAPVLELVLALRLEGLAMRRLAWGLALGAPEAERWRAAA